MRNRYDFISVVSVVIVFVVLEAVSLLLMANNSIVQRFRLIGIVREAQSYFWDKEDRLGYYLDFKEQNDRLIAENLELKRKLSAYEEYAMSFDSSAVTVTPDFTYYRARVVKNSVNTQHNYIIIDKGFRDGVEEGMGVVTDRGVVGLVNAVSGNYSRVISFLDVDQSVSARISDDGVFGPLTWTGAGEHDAVMRDISLHETVTPGDTVLSSGFSAIYPPDIPLGVVVGSKISGGVSQNVSVDIFEDFSSLRFVYVVGSNVKEEISDLYPDE